MNKIDMAKEILRNTVDECRDKAGNIDMSRVADMLNGVLSKLNGRPEQENMDESVAFVGDDYDCVLLSQHLAIRVAEQRIIQSMPPTVV